METIRITSPTASLLFPKLRANPANLKFQSKQYISKFSLRIYISKNSCSSPLFVSSDSSNREKKEKKKQRSPDFLSPFLLPSLRPITPFVQSEWTHILKGWLCSLVSVYCLSMIVPKIGNFSAVLVNTNVNSLSKEGLVLGVLCCVRLIAYYWQQSFLWNAALCSAYKIRVHVFERILARDLGFFEGAGSVSSGDIAYRITAEASNVADTIYALLTMVVPSTLQFGVMATQMLLISPALSLVSALVIPSTCLVIAYLGERLRKISKRAHFSVARLSAYLNEVLPSMLLIKANNTELCESTRFQRLALADLSEHFKKKKMKALIPQIVLMIYVGVVLTICVASLFIWGGSSNGSNIASFITSLFLIGEPIQDVGKAYNELREGEPAIDRLFDLTIFSSQVIEKSDAVDLDSVIGDVKFCNISFRYGDNMPLVLDGLNLHIKPGETVALIGPSGGGKTTLTKLLLRLYDPLCGSILIDDYNIQSIRLKSLRQHVGLVSQDIALLSGTVAENIGYRDLTRKIDMVRVKHAARTANADEFIRALPKGYDTDIGQRGTILSGGQKQRLAIARAIYQNSSILVLDEATSALDSKSEQLVRQAVERLMKDRTVLVVAHRLETILMANRVMVLENGKLEDVPHTSLLNDLSHYGSHICKGTIELV